MAEGGQWPKELLAADLDRLEQSGWELYHVESDPAETIDRAAEVPERLRMLVSMWWHEAGRYGVLPILGGPSRRPSKPSPARRHLFHANTAPIFIEAAPNIINTNYEIVAELQIPAGGANGMILAHGGRFGGYGLLFFEGRPQFAYSYHGIHQTVIAATEPVAAGRRRLRFVFTKIREADLAAGQGAAGTGRLYVDDALLAEGSIDPTAPAMINFSGMMTCGYHPAECFDDRYTAPFAFTGQIHQVVVRTDASHTLSQAVAEALYLKVQ